MEERKDFNDYISEEEAKAVSDLILRFQMEYARKDDNVTDQEWLALQFARELPDITEDEAAKKASEVVEAIHTFDENLDSVNNAAQNGISKESWLADQVQTASSGMDLNQYGQILEAADALFYNRNQELMTMLTPAANGNVPSAAANEAEKMKSTQASGNAAGSRVEYTITQIRNLAKSIGKNAGIMAAFVNATTVGYDLAYKMVKKESAQTDDTAKEEAMKAELEVGAEASVKLITSGALVVAVQKGLLSVIPMGTPVAVLVNIPCAAVENIKIIRRIASGEISATKGLDQMGRVMVSMAGGMVVSAGGSLLATSLVAWIPIVGAPLAAVTGLIGGVAGFSAGSNVGNKIYGCQKKNSG